MMSINFSEETQLEPKIVNKIQKIISKNSHQSFLEDAFSKIKEEVMDEKIGFSNLVIIVIKLIKIVECYKQLNGLEKKSLVLKVIYKYIEDSDIEKDDKDNLHFILDNTGTQIIDSIIFASKGKLFKNFTTNFLKKFKCKCFSS